MRTGKGAIGNTVAVDIEIAAEFDTCLEHLGGHHLAAVVTPALVPVERLDQPIVHADVEIHHDKDRRLQPIGEIQRFRGKGEAFARILGEQQYVLGVAV